MGSESGDQREAAAATDAADENFLFTRNVTS